MTLEQVQLYAALPVAFPRVRQVLVEGLPALEGPREIEPTSEAGLQLAVPGMRLATRYRYEPLPPVDVPGPVPLVRRSLRWEPLDRQRVTPTFVADLEAEPIDAERTMVSLLARYEPPLGMMGAIADRLALHRVAEDALGRFFKRILRELRRAAG